MNIELIFKVKSNHNYWKWLFATECNLVVQSAHTSVAMTHKTRPAKQLQRIVQSVQSGKHKLHQKQGPLLHHSICNKDTTPSKPNILVFTNKRRNQPCSGINLESSDKDSTPYHTQLTVCQSVTTLWHIKPSNSLATDWRSLRLLVLQLTSMFQIYISAILDLFNRHP